MRPPWEISPGSLPSSVSWRQGDEDSILDAWTRWFIGQDPTARQDYLDRHRAPALWRRWLDGQITGKWQNPPAIFFRLDAPMRRLVPASVPQPDRLEALVDTLGQGALPDALSVEIERAWQTGESPWGMVALLAWLERGEVDDAIARMRRVERGELAPAGVGAWLRDRVPRPTMVEVTQRLSQQAQNAGKEPTR